MSSDTCSSELIRLDALAARNLLLRGEVTSLELVDQCAIGQR